VDDRVLAGYEDATGADVRRCRRFVGTSAGSIVASSLVAGRSSRRTGSAKGRRGMPASARRTFASLKTALGSQATRAELLSWMPKEGLEPPTRGL
jgi:predicted acylesterase/phospholipase RssA